MNTSASTVLVADDDPLARKLIWHHLSDTEYHVVSLDPQESFLEKVRSLMPHVILLDVYLRDVNGVDLVTRLRADSMVRDIPVLMITSDTSQETRRAAITAGADDVLEKPLDIARLRSQLKLITRLQQRHHPGNDDHLSSYLADASDEALMMIDHGGFIRAANPTTKVWFGNKDVLYHKAEKLILDIWQPVSDRVPVSLQNVKPGSALHLVRSRLINDGIPSMVELRATETPLARTSVLAITDVSSRVQNHVWRALVQTQVQTMSADDVATMHRIADWYNRPVKTKLLSVPKISTMLRPMTPHMILVESVVDATMAIMSAPDLLADLVNYLGSLWEPVPEIHLRVRKNRLHLYTIYPGSIPADLQHCLHAAETAVLGTLRDSDALHVQARHVAAYMQAWMSGGAIRLLKRTGKPTQVIVDLPLVTR